MNSYIENLIERLEYLNTRYLTIVANDEEIRSHKNVLMQLIRAREEEKKND